MKNDFEILRNISENEESQMRIEPDLRWQKKSERKLKAALVDFLIEKNHSVAVLSAIASEVPFLKGRRRVDILQIGSNELTAFEIKSESDSLKRLAGQVGDYVDTFDRTYLVFSASKQEGIEQFRFGGRLGLIGFDDKTKTFKLIRKAVRNTKILKNALAQFILTDELRNEIGDQSGNMIDLRRKLIQKKSISQIRRIAITSLLERYGERYRLFLRERVGKTYPSDLDILTAESRLTLSPYGIA